MAGTALHASPSNDSYTLELPFEANQATPAWLGHPEMPQGNFASLALPLTAPDPADSLLVTVSFQEKEGGFLRLTWKNSSGEQVLTSNFFQGVAMNNQRSLLIPASVLAGSGTLCLQCGDTVLSVQKVRLEWLENQQALVSPDQEEQQVITGLGKKSNASELDGQPAAGTHSANLDGSVVTVPLTNTPQRIEEGVEFNMQLEGVPHAARIALSESGLPWGQHLVLWVNDQRAGTISPEVPDLRDPGFTLGSGAPYVGWRDGSVYVPVTLLKSGLNSVQISTENDDPDLPGGDDTSAPLAIDHMIGQFDYTEKTAASTVPSNVPDATGPISPDAVPAPTTDNNSTIPSDDLLTVPIPAKP